jgi:predicted DNA-binding protein
MAKEDAGDKETLTIHLPEAVAKRLKLAATRANRPAAEVVVDLLDRNLPRLEDPKKRVPYS